MQIKLASGEIYTVDNGQDVLTLANSMAPEKIFELIQAGGNALAKLFSLDQFLNLARSHHAHLSYNIALHGGLDVSDLFTRSPTVEPFMQLAQHWWTAAAVIAQNASGNFAYRFSDEQLSKLASLSFGDELVVILCKKRAEVAIEDIELYNDSKRFVSWWKQVRIAAKRHPERLPTTLSLDQELALARLPGARTIFFAMRQSRKPTAKLTISSSTTPGQYKI